MGNSTDFTGRIWKKREEHRENTRKYGTNMEFTRENSDETTLTYGFIRTNREETKTHGP